jgi:predicted PP-loop superfamily ATPase
VHPVAHTSGDMVETDRIENEPILLEMTSDQAFDLPPSANVAVAMSGGVDSSVAAARLVEGGVDAFGVTLALWPRNREIVRDRCRRRSPGGYHPGDSSLHLESGR